MLWISVSFIKITYIITRRRVTHRRGRWAINGGPNRVLMIKLLSLRWRWSRRGDNSFRFSFLSRKKKKPIIIRHSISFSSLCTVKRLLSELVTRRQRTFCVSSFSPISRSSTFYNAMTVCVVLFRGYSALPQSHYHVVPAH